MKNFFLKLGICALALTGAAEALAQEQVIQLFAHRGSRFEYDENTLPAFKASYDAGLRGFETDIRMTRDGALVITHDLELMERACSSALRLPFPAARDTGSPAGLPRPVP